MKIQMKTEINGWMTMKESRNEEDWPMKKDDEVMNS